MMRTLTTILALGLVAVMPTLCAAGLITHPCECGSSAGCQHESDCSDDPCGSNNIISSRSQGRHFDSALPIAMTAPSSVFLDNGAAIQASTNVEADASHGAGLPLHASDVPLLI